MPLQEHELDTLFHALSDSTRRAILLRVRARDLSVNEIASQFDISLPAVSKHLNTLERAGLITRSRRGRQRICHVQRRMLSNATNWLEYYQSFWQEKLDNLKHFVESK